MYIYIYQNVHRNAKRNPNHNLKTIILNLFSNFQIQKAQKFPDTDDFVLHSEVLFQPHLSRHGL